MTALMVLIVFLPVMLTFVYAAFEDAGHLSHDKKKIKPVIEPIWIPWIIWRGMLETALDGMTLENPVITYPPNYYGERATKQSQDIWEGIFLDAYDPKPPKSKGLGAPVRANELINCNYVNTIPSMTNGFYESIFECRHHPDYVMTEISLTDKYDIARINEFFQCPRCVELERQRNEARSRQTSIQPLRPEPAKYDIVWK